MLSRHLTSQTLATAIGAVATGSAICLLVADAISSGTWGIDHAFVPVVVLLTVAGGHLASSALRQGKLIASLGFSFVFILGTGVTITNGIGRLSEGSEVKAATARTANDAIASKQAEIADARQRLAMAQTNAERELRGSCGAKCRDWKARADEVGSHLAILEVQLSKLGAVRPLHNAKAARVGELAGLLGLDGHRVTDTFGLIEPLLLPMLLELSAIAGFGFGLGHRRGQRAVVPPASTSRPTSPKRSRRGATSRDPKVVSFVDRFTAKNGRAPTLAEMRSAFPGIPKSTAQRYRGGTFTAVSPLRVVAG